MEVSLQNAVIAAQRYHKNTSDASVLSQLENRLDILNHSLQEWIVSTTFNNSPIRENLILVECLNYFSTFLCSVGCCSSLLTKIADFFYTFVWYNIPARKYCQNDLQLGVSLSLCLVQIVDKFSNASLVIRIVKLFEIISFRCEFCWTNSSSDLIHYLVRSVTLSRSPNAKIELENDVKPFCLGVLNNICSKSVVVRDYVRRMEHFEKFCNTLMELLQNDMTSVVVNSLTLIITLNEKLKDLVLSAKNSSQTFQCVFNVVIKGDNFMARHHAVDLLCRLLDQSAMRSLITKYQHLAQTMQNISALFVTLDPQREQLYNIYELFLRFCQHDNLKRNACAAITQSGPVNPSRLTTPLLAILECSKIPTESSLIPELPLKALKLLKFVLEIVVKGNNRIQNYISSDILARLIEECLKSSIETGHPLVVEKCQRIVLCLQLASVASLDEEVRSDLLEIVTPALCAHIFEFQMISNPVSVGTNGKLANWSKFGVKIVMELIALLQLLEPFSKQHKEIYWRYLKDSRIVPFVAYAFASGDEKLVDKAFTVSFKMAQLDGFTSKWLSELIATNSRNLTNSAETRPSVDEINGNSSQPVYSSYSMPPDEKVLDELLEKMKNTLYVSDPKITEIIQLYERKIGAMHVRERHLHELDAAKTAALHQADLTINQYRISRPESELEAQKLRSLLHETEVKSEQALGQVNSVKAELDSVWKTNRQLEIKCKNLEAELESSKDLVSDFTLKMAALKQANETSKREIESEKEMHDVLRKHYEKMKNNFETTSEKLLAVEEELKQTKKQLKENQTSLKTVGETVEKLEGVLCCKEEEISVLEKSLEDLRKTMENAEKEKKYLLKQIGELEAEVIRKVNVIKEHEKTINRMKDDVAKFANITQAIHQMTSSKTN